MRADSQKNFLRSQQKTKFPERVLLSTTLLLLENKVVAMSPLTQVLIDEWQYKKEGTLQVLLNEVVPPYR
jgi:hypothetical protein